MDSATQSQPWTVSVYSTQGQCLRLFVSSTAFDSELVVIAPNGAVYRDDDSGGSNRPLVKIASAPNTGWYTVQVGHHSGTPTVANFTLLYGRYNAGNPNCWGETVPLSSAAAAAASSKSVVPETLPKAGSPAAEFVH